VYIGDTSTRSLLWETRVTDLLTDFGYRSTRQALAALRSAYGLHTADLNEYHRERDGHGWLLAWAPQVMRPLDVHLPYGFRFGQNGYRLLAPGEASHLGLPAAKRRPPLGMRLMERPDCPRRSGVLRRCCASQTGTSGPTGSAVRSPAHGSFGPVCQTLEGAR
jgi:hypothetical protein